MSDVAPSCLATSPSPLVSSSPVQPDSQDRPAFTSSQIDRIEGTLLASAIGDVMGVPYESGEVKLEGAGAASSPQPDAANLPTPQLLGGGLGLYAPGEWSDDTQMMLHIARVAATGADLTSSEALDAIARGWCRWLAQDATCVGTQTRQVIAAVAASADRPGISKRMRQAAADLHERTGRSAGNGALMRNSVVALTRLDDRHATAAAARAVAELTHADPLAGDSCVIHAEMIRQNIMAPAWSGAPFSAAVPLRALDLIPEERRGYWHDLFDGGAADPARCVEPPQSDRFTVFALAHAVLAFIWTNRAAYRAGQPGLRREDVAGFWMRTVLLRALAASRDKDTVTALTGAVAGSYLGASALEAGGLGQWVEAAHGLPAVEPDDTWETGATGGDLAAPGDHAGQDRSEQDRPKQGRPEQGRARTAQDLRLLARLTALAGLGA